MTNTVIYIYVLFSIVLLAPFFIYHLIFPLFVTLFELHCIIIGIINIVSHITPFPEGRHTTAKWPLILIILRIANYKCLICIFRVIATPFGRTILKHGCYVNDSCFLITQSTLAFISPKNYSWIIIFSLLKSFILYRRLKPIISLFNLQIINVHAILTIIFIINSMFS